MDGPLPATGARGRPGITVRSVLRLPHELVNFHFHDLAPDRHGREPARRFAQLLRHGFHGFARGEHLTGEVPGWPCGPRR